MNELQSVFSELSPYSQEVLKFVATAAGGGVIGNRVDAWFSSLFFHQRSNIIKWLQAWNPSEEDVQQILANDNVRYIFSKVLSEVSSEIEEKKLLLWPVITSSILNDELKLDTKKHFVSLFSRIDVFALQYLAALYIEKELGLYEFSPNDGKPFEYGTKQHIYNLGWMATGTSGLIETVLNPIGMRLSRLGQEFVAFISDGSTDLLHEILNDKTETKGI